MHLLDKSLISRAAAADVGLAKIFSSFSSLFLSTIDVNESSIFSISAFATQKVVSPDHHFAFKEMVEFFPQNILTAYLSFVPSH